MDVLSSAGLTIIGIILLDNSVYFARQMKIDSPGLLEKKKKKSRTPFSLLQFISSISNPEKYGLKKLLRKRSSLPPQLFIGK